MAICDFIFRTAIYTNFRNYQLINNSYVSLHRYFKEKYAEPTNKTLLFHFFYFLLTRRKAAEALIHRVGNYPDLLPEIPRYCCPLVI